MPGQSFTIILDDAKFQGCRKIVRLLRKVRR